MAIAPQKQTLTDGNFTFSNESCCFRCSRLFFDMQKGTCCSFTQKQVKPYNVACSHFNEICGRFGGFTKP